MEEKQHKMNECTKEEIIRKLEETQEVDENVQEIGECDTNTEQLDDDTTEKIYSDTEPLMSEFEIECFDDVAGKHDTRTESPDDIEENISNVDIKTNNYEEHVLLTQNLDETICDNEKSEEGKTLSRETRVDLPIPSHSEKEPFKCDICNKGSKTCECLKVDKEECSVCHEIFYWTSRLVDTVKKPSCCTTCMVPRSENEDIQTGKKLFECEICGKTVARSGMSRHKRKHKGEKRYECEICYKKFTEKASLNAHLRIHTGEKPFTCPIQDCSKSYRYKSQLSSHIRKHTGKYYNCSICGESFTNQSCLRNHMLVVHTHECEICFTKFPEKETLTNHLKNHIGFTGSFDESKICDRNLPENETMTNHLNIHIGDTQFTAAIKDTSGESISDLDMLKTEDCIDILEENLELEVKTKHCIKSKNGIEDCHLGSENIREETCILSDDNADVDNIIKYETLNDESFTSKHNDNESETQLNEEIPNQLNQHNNIHSDKKLSECDICGKILQRKGMSRHKRTHTGERRFECEICHKKFTENTSLNDHLRIHTGEKPFTCPIQNCSKSFRYKLQLSSHIKKHTGMNYNCLICRKSFTSQSCFKNHMMDHNEEKPYECKKLSECDICGKIVARSGMSRHKKIHTGDRRFECEICYKKFMENAALNAHLRIHTGEKPFTCPIQDCSKSFRYKSQLSSHIKKHTGKYYNCSICGESFTNQSCLRNHMLVHTQENPNFPENETLTNHLNIHIGDTQFTDAIKDTSEESVNNFEILKTEDCITISEENNLEPEVKVKDCLKSKNGVKEFYLESENIREETCILSDDNADVDNMIKYETLDDESFTSRHNDNETETRLNEETPSGLKKSNHLNQHNNIRSSKKLCECDICGKILVRSGMSRHKKIHTGERRFECEICHKKFTEKTHLNDHLRIHTGEKPFTCPIQDCSKSFRYKSQLSSHIRKHSRIDYNCSICGKSFTSQSCFKNHMLIHDQEKPYECEICDLKFSKQEILTKHLNIHIGTQFSDAIKEESINDFEILKTEGCIDISEENNLELEVKIKDCLKSKNSVEEFYLKSEIITEETCILSDNNADVGNIIKSENLEDEDLTSRHNDNETDTHVNEEVPSELNTPNQLNQHSKIHSGKRSSECKFCGKSFTSIDNLNKHIRIHTREEKPYKCDICHTRFKNRTNLNAHSTGENNTKLYKCSICGIAIKSQCNLKRHIQTHTGEKSSTIHNGENNNRFRECSICGISISQGSIKRHIRTHTGERPYECDICHKKFTSKSSMINHTMIHTGEKPFICSFENCQKQFRYRKSLNIHKRTHMQVHTGEKLFECDICHKTFIEWRHLNEHKRIHTGENVHSIIKPENIGEEPFVLNNDIEKIDNIINCDESFISGDNHNASKTQFNEDMYYKCLTCNDSLRTPDELNQHSCIHRGGDGEKNPTCNKLYQCSICGISVSSSNLRRHMRIHTGEKPYECDICHTKFNQKGSLKDHSRIHTGEKPFTCSFQNCLNSFRHKSSLVIHIRAIHSGEKKRTCNKLYKCSICGISLSSQRNLKAHMQIHTGEKPHECDICHKKFTQKGSLTDHKRIHTGEKPFTCSFQNCLKPFRHKSALVTHIKIIHNGEKKRTCNMSYKCSICEISVSSQPSLRRHMRIHTGVKPYECDICHNKFTTKPSLIYHTRIHTGEKPFTCSFQNCLKPFRNKASLVKHIRTNHTRKNKRTCNKGSVKTHMQINTEEKPFECDIRHKRFIERRCLNEHIRIHTEENVIKPENIGEEPFILNNDNQEIDNLVNCETSKNKGFHTASELSQRSSTHTENENIKEEILMLSDDDNKDALDINNIIKCESLVDDAFILNDNDIQIETQLNEEEPFHFEEHSMGIHSEELLSKCNICNKCNKICECLKDGTGECSICHKEFCEISKLGDTNEKPFTCTSCEPENLDKIKEIQTESKVDDFHLKNENIEEEILILSDDDKDIDNIIKTETQLNKEDSNHTGKKI